MIRRALSFLEIRISPLPLDFQYTTDLADLGQVAFANYHAFHRNTHSSAETLAPNVHGFESPCSFAVPVRIVGTLSRGSNLEKRGAPIVYVVDDDADSLMD